MNPRHEEIYLAEMARQINCAMSAQIRLHAALGRRDVLGVYDEAADFLQHAANASKMLFPDPRSKEHSKTRGKALCKRLGISGEHLISKRALRNHLEHIDERMDMWLGSIGDGFMVDANIGPRASVSFERILRHYDPETETFTFLDQDYSLRELRAALDELGAIVRERRIGSERERLIALQRATWDAVPEGKYRPSDEDMQRFVEEQLQTMRF